MPELRGPNELNLPRDHAPLVYVTASTWHCIVCDPDDVGAVAVTTVVWLGPNTDGPSGRCSSCGQKYMLARAGEHVPDPLEQIQRYAPE